MFHHYFSQIGLASPLSLTRIELIPIIPRNEKRFPVYRRHEFHPIIKCHLLFLERKMTSRLRHIVLFLNFEI